MRLRCLYLLYQAYRLTDFGLCFVPILDSIEELQRKIEAHSETKMLWRVQPISINYLTQPKKLLTEPNVTLPS